MVLIFSDSISLESIWYYLIKIVSDCCAPPARGQFRMILKKNSGAAKNELQAASLTAGPV